MLLDANDAGVAFGRCGLGQPHRSWADREGCEIEFIHRHVQPSRISVAAEFASLTFVIVSSGFNGRFHFRFSVED